MTYLVSFVIIRYVKLIVLVPSLVDRLSSLFRFVLTLVVYEQRGYNLKFSIKSLYLHSF